MKKTASIVLLLLLAGALQVHAGQQLTIYTEEFQPYNFTSGSEVVGVSTEVVDGVLAEAGMSATKKCLPWADSYKLAQQEENALIYSIGRVPEREKLFKWIGVIVPTTYSVMSLATRDDIKIARLEDLKKYRVGTTMSDIMENWLLSKGFALSDFVRLGGENATLKQYRNLLNKRIDLWPAPDAVAFYVARKEGQANPDLVLRKSYPLEELSGGYYMAAGLKTPDSTVAELAAALKKFKQKDEYPKILAHWGISNPGAGTSAPIAKLLYSLKSLARIENVGYLASDTISAHEEAGLFRKEMREGFVERYARDFGEWCRQYEALQGEVNAILIGSTEGMAGWDRKRALNLIGTKTSVPTGCLTGDLTDLVLLGFEEKGMVLNQRLAQKLNIKFPNSMLSRATRIIK